MDKENLNNAADTAFLENYFPSATEEQDHRWDLFNDGFKQGAQWLLSRPLSERLTEEEKERIKRFYHTIWGKNVLKLQKGLSEIFGTDLITNQPND